MPGPAVPPEAGFSVDVQNAVARVTLNRPDRRNPQTPDTWTWLARVGSALPASVRVVVVAGTGPSFSAGLDRALFGAGGSLAALAGQSPAEAERIVSGYQAGFAWLAEPRLISIAVVQGHAVGAGFQLALACDLRIAAADAVFTMAEPSLGLVPDLGGTKRLVELVGYSRAADICLTGRRVGAEEARQIGLVSTVVPPDALAPAIDDTVTAVLAVPRDASIETKALLRAAGERTQRDQESAERAAQYRRLRDLAGLVDER